MGYKSKGIIIYLDDCYIALDANIVNPSELFETLNRIHKNIKFAMKQHDLHLPFLDILLNKDSESNKVWMDICYGRVFFFKCTKT